MNIYYAQFYLNPCKVHHLRHIQRKLGRTDQDCSSEIRCIAFLGGDSPKMRTVLLQLAPGYNETSTLKKVEIRRKNFLKL